MDEDGGFFASLRVGIVGLGLMGGSLALALRGRCAGLLGVDPDPAARQLALERSVVDRASAGPEGLLSEADIIILAAPVGAILELIPRLPDLHPGRPFVIDLGSTKVRICQALEALPERFEAVGGHPMCGKENLTLANADPDLYRGAVIAFTPIARTTGRARRAAETLAGAVGARPFWLAAEAHDRWVAATSHVPYLAGNALAAITPSEAAPLAGPGYRSTTRLAVTPGSMISDVLVTNRIEILEQLRRFQGRLTALEQALDLGNFETLNGLLEQGAARQKEILR
jgi:prephenate dehydrogenase